MDSPPGKTRVSTFELFIAFGNCIVWLVAVYVLYRRIQEKRHLAAQSADPARQPLAEIDNLEFFRPRDWVRVRSAALDNLVYPPLSDTWKYDA